MWGMEIALIIGIDVMATMISYILNDGRFTCH
jgi:hypothetical protein